MAFKCIVNLRTKALVPPKLVVEADRLWKQGQYDHLIQTARKDGGLLGQVIEEVVRHRTAGYQITSQLAGDVAAREIRRHMQRLFPIPLVATLEPLLGLLGTMLGMIGAFETVAVAGSMGDASILADDIAKAMVTTAVGLIIAIPAVFMYHYLKSQIGFGSASLDQAASGLISDWMLLNTNDTSVANTTELAGIEPGPATSDAEVTG
ncbi:MotA/TolQ/ExbB proton channel family protein [Neorhodopirellula lusitana]|uniref:MotA/TolQ/ExbB proton channel family protein n=1 Tax=Neorhodopirellula lusitana TaxID=445327 RepID=UPI00384AFAC9